MPWRAIIYMIDPAEKQKGATQKDGTKKDVIKKDTKKKDVTKKDPKKKVQKKGAIRKRCDMKFKHAKIPTVQRAIDKTDCVGRHFSLNCQKTFSQKSPQFSSSQRPKIPLLMTGTHTNKGSEVRELIRETQDINMDRLLFGEGRGGYQPLIPLLCCNIFVVEKKWGTSSVYMSVLPLFSLSNFRAKFFLQIFFLCFCCIGATQPILNCSILGHQCMG